MAEGRYDVSVPLTTGDELGELASSFNEMVEGLAERERLREVFGTYLDKEIAEYILSEGFAEEGEEVEVSVLVCDVRDFTSFAARASAKEVVSRLNELFEVIVPIVGRHGGHVDKFLGDGLLGVFGAPEPFPDHADRAVLAACEMASKVNSRDDLGLRIGVGVNTGLGGRRVDRRRRAAQLQRDRRRGQRRRPGGGRDARGRRGRPDHRPDGRAADARRSRPRAVAGAPSRGSTSRWRCSRRAWSRRASGPARSRFRSPAETAAAHREFGDRREAGGLAQL